MTYPDWAAKLPTHLAADTVDGRPVIRYVYVDGIFWDSGCRVCLGRKQIVELMPNHEAGSGCESGRHSHCTCDRCF